jgi:hypothetical protein
MAYVALVLWSVIATGTGCVSKELDRRLQAQMASSAGQTVELTRLNEAGGSEPLDWNSALKLLREQNLVLQQARSRVAQLKLDRERQWRTWLPRLGLYASLLNSLSQLGSLSTSDLNASVVMPLNIPNPVSERAQAFANALSYLEGQDSLELTYRRQVVALYRIFSRHEALLGRSDEEPPDGGPDQNSIASGLRTIENRASQQDALRSLQGNLAQLLNLPGRQPTPLPATRPKLDYQNQLHQLVPGRNYGRLAVRLSAYQIEGALLREKGIKLRQWPLIWLSGSMPALYDNQRDESGGYFNADEVYLFAGLSKTYDLTGREARSIETAEENTAFVKQNLRLRLDQETREWARLCERYRQLLVRRRLAQERLRLVQRGGGGSAFADLTALRAAREGLASLDQAKEQLDLEIWVWDDEQWK